MVNIRTETCVSCRGNRGRYIVDYGQEIWRDCGACRGNGTTVVVDRRTPRFKTRKPVGRTRLVLATSTDGKHFVHFYDKTGPYRPPIRIREKDIVALLNSRDD